MITAGIDVGARTTKVVIVKNGRVAAKSRHYTAFETRRAIETAMDDAGKQAGIGRGDIEKMIATGTGAVQAEFLTRNVITEVTADAAGIFTLDPSIRTLLDVGAEEGRAVRIDNEGVILDFVVNEKCAAGSGTFVETISRALEVSLEDFGKISLDSDNDIPTNAHCVVFAESEVVTLIHSKYEKKDIAKAVHSAIAERIVSMLRRIAIEKPIALVGGVSRNVGFVSSLNHDLQTEVKLYDEPEYVGALGAAVLAAS
jgi:benzoyl-CoA reductase subunit D